MSATAARAHGGTVRACLRRALACALLALAASGHANAGPTCPYLYAVEAEEPAILRVFPTASMDGAVSVRIAEAEDSPAGGPFDGLAFDSVRRRLHFASGRSVGGTVLLSYDLASDAFTATGELAAEPAGASFHDGGYYYVPVRSDELRRVDFTLDGEVRTDVLVAVFGFAPGFRLEDLAIRHGVAYGSSSSDDPDVTPRFFAYDLASGTLTTLSTAHGTFLQLAFGQDGTLYGVAAGDGTFYEVDERPEGEGVAEDSRTVATGAVLDVTVGDLAGGGVCP